MSAPLAGQIGMGSTIGGGLLQAGGALAQGNAQAGMYNYQAGVADINAQISLQNATYARQKGEADAQNYGLKGAQQAAQIKIAQASSGLDINSGSAKDVQTSEHTVQNLDLTQIRSNAAKTAYDYTTQATQYQNQAGLDRLAGENSQRAGLINSMSSILGTTGSVSTRWLQSQQVGLPMQLLGAT